MVAPIAGEARCATWRVRRLAPSGDSDSLLPRATSASCTLPPGNWASSRGTTNDRSKNRHEKMSKYARSSRGNTCRLTWLSAIIVMALSTGWPSASFTDDVGPHDRGHADLGREPVEEVEERVQGPRALVGVDVQEEMGAEVVLDVRLGVLEILPLDGPDAGHRARKDGLEQCPEPGRVEVVRRHQVGEIRLPEREGVEREVARRPGTRTR